MLLSIPLIREWKKRVSDKPITLLCRAPFGDLMMETGLVDKVIQVDKSQPGWARRIQNQLKAESWEYIVCPHESFRSARLIGPLKAKNGKFGFKSWWNAYFFNHRHERVMKWPDALRQLSLLTLADPEFSRLFSQTLRNGEWDNLKNRKMGVVFDKALPEWASMHVPKFKSDQAMASKTNGRAENLIAMAPGSVWATKRWTIDGFRQLAVKLLDQGYGVEILGSPKEVPIADEISKGIPLINSVGKTNLVELAHKVSKAKLLVTNDSGTMHISSMVGTPVVAIFGPTTLDIGYRPWQSQAVVAQVDLPCRPCGLHGSHSCPIGTHQCMKDISADQIFEFIESPPKTVSHL